MPARQILSRWSAIAAILALYGLAGALSRAVHSDLTLLPYLLPLGFTLYNLGPPVAYASCPPAALAWLTLRPPFVHPSWPSPWAVLGLSLFFGLFTLLATRLPAPGPLGGDTPHQPAPSPLPATWRYMST